MNFHAVSSRGLLDKMSSGAGGWGGGEGKNRRGLQIKDQATVRLGRNSPLAV